MPSWLPGILVALVGIVPGVLVWVQADAARKQADREKHAQDALEARKADRDELASARQFWIESLGAANSEIGKLRTDLQAEQAETRRLRSRIGRLEEVIRRAGLAVPNGSEQP